MKLATVKIGKTAPAQCALYLLAVVTLLLTTIACGAEQSESGDITDGYTMTDTVQAEGYQFVLWQLPERPVIGSVQFGVTLTRADGTVPELKPRIDIYAFPPDSERIEDAITTVASSTNRFPQFYEGIIEFETEGDWEIEFRASETVSPGNFTPITSVFTTINVAQRNRTGGTLVQGTVFFFSIQMVFLTLIGVVFYRARRRRKRFQSDAAHDAAD